MTWERFAADRARAEAEIERLQAALAKEQHEHATCEDVNAQRFQVLTDTIINLTQQITVMRPIVTAVAEAAVGDEYGGGSWLMFAGYDAETVRVKARAALASGQAAESEGE